MTPIRPLAILGIAALASPAQAEGDPLARYGWTSRVLVVSAPAADDARLLSQRKAVAAAGPEVTERDLVVVEAVGSGPEAERLRRRLGLPAGAFRAVLVGKDGEAKMTEPEPISTATLFSTIDAMPMRRDESRRR